MPTFDPYAFAGGFLLGVVVALLVTAWLYEDDLRRAHAIAAQARKDAADAQYRAAVAAERAEHARAEIEWRGRFQ